MPEERPTTHLPPKREKSVTFSIHIPVALRREIDRLAKTLKTNRNQVILAAIRDYLGKLSE